MSGHSHWSSIKHKKAATDKKRGKLFSKLVKHVMGAARGGADPKANLRLQYAVNEAKAAGVPKDTIERAILKGSGQLEGVRMETVRYEGYGPGGAAIVVDSLTDNRNRTSALVRKAFERHGGNVGASGCVAWKFERKGLFLLQLGERSEDDVFMLVADAGAEDFQRSGDYFELTCPVESFANVKKTLEDNQIPVESAELTLVPKEYVDLDMSAGRKVLGMMEELDEIEDIESVHANFNLPEELAEV